MDWIKFIHEDSDLALTQVYAECKGQCVAWLKKNTNLNHDNCIEIFQTSVIILYENVINKKLLHLDSKISTYLISICKNKARDFRRATAKYSSTSVFPLLTDHCQEDIQEKKEKELKLSVISKMLNKMGDPCKTLLHLFYFKKMSLEEIKNLMGYNNSATTKNQKYKCMKRLQKLCLSINS